MMFDCEETKREAIEEVEDEIDEIEDSIRSAEARALSAQVEHVNAQRDIEALQGRRKRRQDRLRRFNAMKVATAGIDTNEEDA